MLVCWDLAFPEAFRELIYQGAKIIILPAFCKQSLSHHIFLKILGGEQKTEDNSGALTDCSEPGLARNPTAEAVFLDSTLTARTFENTCGRFSSLRS